MDNNTVIWDILKTIGGLLWLPMGAYMTYKMNRDNRDKDKAALIENRISLLEQQSNIHNIQIDTLKESLHQQYVETKDSIKEVKQGVDKLIERLIK